MDVIFTPNSSSTVFNLTSMTGPACSTTGTPNISSATVVTNPLPAGTISSPASSVLPVNRKTWYLRQAAGTGPYSLTINGGPFPGVTTATPFNAGTVPLNTDYRLWVGTLPVPSAQNDGFPVEVGMKFRPGFNGSITALRFYKGVANTDPIVLNLIFFYRCIACNNNTYGPYRHRYWFH